VRGPIIGDDTSPMKGPKVLMHQSIGLDAFNALPHQKAVHALYECCNSVVLARAIAAVRPYDSRDELFRRADSLLFALSDSSVDTILEAYPHVGRRPGSTKSNKEQCSVWDPRPDIVAALDAAAQRYTERFGFSFVMFVDGLDAEAVLTAISERMQHDAEMERKIVCNELAKINRTRLERMLGPEGGYHNW
jgi:2-oxo-4-hydroxy-4-carboxy-5-ureidoimidazoline decarboxylase